MIYANARRQIEKIPENRLDFRPVEEIRSVAELVVHMHQYLTDATESILAGKHVEGEEPKIRDKATLLKWTEGQVTKGYGNLRKVTEAQLQQVITAWGEEFPGWQLLNMVPTEAIHHRGQLSVYLRLNDIPVPSIYGPSADEGQA